MRWVRMAETLSGGGPGGRDWRDYPAGASLEVEDWEAEDLIRIRLAVPDPEGGKGVTAAPEPGAAAPAAESEPGAGAPAAAPEDGTGVSPLAQASPLAEVSGTAAGVLPAPEPEPEPPPPLPPEPPPEPEPLPVKLPPPEPPVVLRPLPADPKQAWVDYAIAQGEDPDVAPRLTKADIMSKYGGRLLCLISAWGISG